jgi:TPR repeat protein
MTFPSPADDSAASKCIECGAAISSKAKFCEECGAIQAASPTSSLEPVGEALPELTASGIESQSSAPPQLSSTAANQTSNPAESGSVDERDSTQKKLFRIYGITAAVAVVIVLVCIGAWYLRVSDRQKATDDYNLGVAYENGQGVPQDEAQAVTWYRKAAEHGNADAENKLGTMYENGSGGLAKDETQAVSWYRKAAEQGHAYAQNNLGVMYATGRGGLPKDETQAVSWYQKAANQGNSDAQVNLASRYESGSGGSAKDDGRAVSLYQKAAEQGNAAAKSILAQRLLVETLSNMTYVFHRGKSVENVKLVNGKAETDAGSYDLGHVAIGDLNGDGKAGAVAVIHALPHG